MHWAIGGAVPANDAVTIGAVRAAPVAVRVFLHCSELMHQIQSLQCYHLTSGRVSLRLHISENLLTRMVENGAILAARPQSLLSLDGRL